MSPRSTLLVGGGVLALALAVLLFTHELGLGRRDDGSPRFPYVLEDVYDRMAYQQRGRWIASGGTPYLDEFSEYPQLSTWLMALPYLFYEEGVERGEPFTSIEAARAVLREGNVPEEVAERACPLPPKRFPDVAKVAVELARYPGLDRDTARTALLRAQAAHAAREAELLEHREAYGDAHHVLMAGWFLLLLFLATRNLRALGHGPAWALLLLLPASLYFGFNRFDLVVTCAVACAIWLQLTGRRNLAGLALGVAIMVKWYPLVLVPLFLSHGVRASRAPPGEVGWGTALVRGALVPGALAAAVIFALLGVTFVWDGGGMEAVRFVFDWHANERQPNHSSFLALLTHPDRWGWFDRQARGGLEVVFKLCQLAPGFLLALAPVRSARALLLGCLAATLSSVVFSEFFSPQWVLWVTALSVLLAPTARGVLALAVALEIVMYLQLPLFWYSAQASGDTGAFWSVTNVRMVLLLAFLAAALALFAREVLKGSRGPLTASAPPA